MKYPSRVLQSAALCLTATGIVWSSIAANTVGGQQTIQLNESKLRSGSLSDTKNAPSTGVFIELKDKPTLIENGHFVRQQAAAKTTDADGALAGASEIRAYRAALATKQSAVVDALKGLISESDINRFDLVSNAVFVKGGDVAMVRSAVSSNPLAASLVKQISSSNTVVANLGESVPLIGAPQLWELTSGSGDKLNGTGIKIGILDTGVDYTHPDLGGCFGPDCKVAGGYDFVDNDNDPFDTFSGHGTSVAAIAAGIGSYRDSAGTTQPLLGVAPGAKIYAYRVLEQAGFGTEANVMNGLERCVDPDGDGNFSDRLDVCNLSFNTPGTPDSPLSLAVDAASAAGVVVVVSAGEVNDRDKFITMGSPANARSAITVGASCKPGDTSRWCSDGIYSYQMAGPVVGHPDIFKPDVVAPGVEICAALALKNDIGDTANCLDDKHIIRSGTSFAAPHVAGLAALLKQAYPTASPETVKALVSGGAKELPGDRQLRGAGLVNAYDSYSKLQGQSNIATLEGLPLKLDLDPARGAGTERRVVKITNTTNAPRIFTPSLLNSSLSATFTPNEIELAPGEQGLVTIDFSTGGTDAASGSLVQGLVSFTSGDDSVSGWVYGVVGPRFSADTVSIDYGTVANDEGFFTNPREITLTNHSAQQDITVSASVEFDDENDYEGWYKRVEIRLSSTTVTIPAGATSRLAADLYFNCDGVPNREYRGFLNFSASGQKLRIPFTVFKGYKLKIDHGTQGPKPEYIVVYNPDATDTDATDAPATYEAAPNSKDASTVFKLTKPGPWFIDAHYPNAVVFKSGLPLTGTETTVNISDSEATIRIGTDALRPDGAEPTEGFAVTSISQGSKFVSRGSTIAQAKNGLRVNKFTSDIVYSAAYVETHQSDFYVWQYFTRGTGATQDVTLRQGEFVEKFINAPQNTKVEDTTNVQLFGRAVHGGVLPSYSYRMKGYDTFATANAPINLDKGKLARVFASKNTVVSPDSADFLLQPSFFLAAFPSSYDRASRSPENFYIGTSSMFIGEGESYSLYRTARWWESYRSAVLRPDTSDTLSLGAGPEFSNYRWHENTQYAPKFGEGSLGYSFEGGADIRGPHRMMSYSLYRDNELIQSGELQPYDGLGEGTDAGGPLSPGAHKLVTTYKQLIDGKEMSEVAETRFTHTADDSDDQSPPALDRLAIVANELLQNVIDPSVQNVMAFTLDPVIWRSNQEDALRDVTAEYSADGVKWSSLVVDTVSPTEYTSALKVDANAEIHHMRISALDSSGNAFVYTFQMPSGNSLSRPSFQPTPTPLSTNTPEPTPTAEPTSTATPTPTPTDTPVPGPRANNVALPPFKASVKNRTAIITIPALRQSPDLVSLVKANKLFDLTNWSGKNMRAITNPTNMLATCTLQLNSSSSSLTRSFSLRLSRGSRLRVPRLIPDTHSGTYTCRIEMAGDDSKVKASASVGSDLSSFTIK